MTTKSAIDSRFLPFLLMTILHLVTRWMEFDVIAGVSKALLMPLLLLVVFKASKGSTGFHLLMSALFLSWVGDVLLLFTEVNELYFIGGLVAFLLAHICYIFLFRRAIDFRQIDKPIALIGALGILGYASFMLWYLHPLVDSVLFPAIVAYAIIISIMLYSALLQYRSPLPSALRLILFGAVLFILSDTLLALAKFGNMDLPTRLTDFFIMLTYCSAQAAITKGSLMVYGRTKLG